jgi:uncharacterized membrane protein YccF (DUF307 family)
MKVLGNILWLVLGGVVLAVAYALAGLISFAFIITIPFGIQSFKLASFALWPFGRVLIRRPGAGAVSSGIGNIIWFIVGGWWLALVHVVAAALNAITIIGIPFAIAHLKLARVAAWPFGYSIASAAKVPPETVVVGV